MVKMCNKNQETRQRGRRGGRVIKERDRYKDTHTSRNMVEM